MDKATQHKNRKSKPVGGLLFESLIF